MNEASETATQVGRELSHLLAAHGEAPPAAAVQTLMARLIRSQATTAADAYVLACWAQQLVRDVRSAFARGETAEACSADFLLQISEALMSRATDTMEIVIVGVKVEPCPRLC